MGQRRKARELALKTLYLMDVTGISLEEASDIILYGNKENENVLKFMKEIVYGTTENKTQIDNLITKYAKNWELSRMATVDRNILRIGTYEILKTPETPINVIIDEAVEIAKIYSTSDSGKFVNGILDKIKKERNEIKK
ncbi:MAG: transcription antitermination factor NusB [Endomicrobiia bacterium]